MKRETWHKEPNERHILFNKNKTKYACAYCGKFLGMVEWTETRETIGEPGWRDLPLLKGQNRPTRIGQAIRVSGWVQCPNVCKKRACQVARSLS